MIDFYIISALLVLFLIMGLLLRYPFINLPLDEDFGFYIYLPHFYKRGVRFVKDFWIGFPSILTSFYLFVYKRFGNDPRKLRSAFTIYNIFNTVAVFLLSQYLFGAQTALFAAFIYSLYSSSPHLGTYSSNAEGLYVLPVTLAIYAFSKGYLDEEAVYFVFSGMFFAVAFLLKIVNIATFAIFSFFLILQGESKSVLNIAGGFTGVLIVYFTSITYKYWGKNRLCWSQHNTRTKITLSYIEKNLKRLLGRIFINLKPIFQESSTIWFLSFLFFIYFIDGEKSRSEIILFLWAISTLLILILQRAFWTYHYIPLIHLFSILSAVALYKFYTAFELYPNSTFAPVAVIVLFLFSKDIYYKVRLLYLYRKDIKAINFLKGDQYFLVPVVAEYIKKNSAPEDYIYVWGSLVQIYVLADRRSCEGFLYHYIKPYSRQHEPLFDEIIGGIISKRPRFVVTSRPDFNMEVLEQITGLEYELQRVFFNRYGVYKLTGKKSTGMNVGKLRWEKKKDLMESLSPGTMDAQINEYYIDKKMYDKAMEEYMEALALDPHDIITNMGLAQLLRKKYRYSEAMKKYIEILNSGKYKGWVYLEMAFTCNEMGNYSESIKYFKKAISKWCSKEWGYLGIGIAYREMGNYDTAFEYFAKAKKLNQSMKSFHIEMGKTYRGLSKYKEAFEEFEKALKIDPLEEWAHFEMGIAFKGLGEHNKALTEFEKECQLNETNLLAKYNYLSTMKLLGKEDHAIQGFLGILSDNTHPQLKSGSNFHLGEIFFKKNNYQKANTHFQACLELTPSHKKAAEYLETINLKEKAEKIILK